MLKSVSRTITATAILAAVAFAVTSCASSSGAVDSTAKPSTAKSSIYPDNQGNCSVKPLKGVDYKAAQAIVTKYKTTPNKLPITTPLPKPISPDITIDYLNNGTPVGGTMWANFEPAAKAAGVKVKVISTGTSAQTINAALNSVVSDQPNIVVGVALDPTFYASQLKTLQDNGTTVIMASIIDASKFGLIDTFGGYGPSIENGRVMAAAAVAQTCGATKDFVFYEIPELPFSPVQLKSAQSYLAKICDSCNLRVVDIPVATLTTTAGNSIVNDLLAHPKTKYFISSSDTVQIGLLPKEKLAGISVPGLGQSSLPANIEQIVRNQQSAGFGVDLNEYMWLLLDQGLRTYMKTPPDYTDWSKINPLISQIITTENAKKYTSGFVAYPGFEKDFLKLWGK